MTVFVDTLRPCTHRRIGALSAHMIADNEHELENIARDIGLRRQWRQVSNKGILHYDLSMRLRAVAITKGAKPSALLFRQCVRRLVASRDNVV